MRMRKKKHGAERIAACSALLTTKPETPMADPNVCFDAPRTLALEIGCGKGSFACGMAAAHPDVNFFAMERVSDCACIALEKATSQAENRTGDNLRFMIGDAKTLTEYFEPHTFDRLYLNFSDPWPKAGHAKRRLTHRGFLEIYRGLLKAGGMLYFKTDNEGLFDFSLEEFEAAGLTIEWQTRDLHNTEKAAENIMTEYETNFSSKGFPIYSAWVRF